MRISRPIALGVLGLAAGHVATVLILPHLLMAVAMHRISGGGDAMNRWIHQPRITEASRGVVRPSPDLAYSACVFDLSRGPVRIRVAPGADYWSLSLYAANSDNFFVRNDREAPGGAEIVLALAGQSAPPGAVRSPSARGIALERRLAPTPGAFSAAHAARRADLCGALPRRAPAA